MQNPWAGMLVYTLLVILFGAVVRITGSGAGCGQHWPTCQGEIAHLPRTLETLIEYTHRVTSGVALIAVLWLSRHAFRRPPPRDLQSRSAVAASAFMVLEALIGAALVLLQYVGENDSLGRAVIMALHLVNTLALTWAMGWAALAWRSPAVTIAWRAPAARALLLGAFGITVVAGAGAVTALGDTLYPVADAAAAAAVTEPPGAHFLERARGFHPLLAVAVSGALLWLAPAVARRCPSPEQGARWAQALAGCIFLQLAIGLLNIWLSAPGWMQVLHLAFALALWLCWVGLGFAALGRSTEPG